MTDRAQGAQRRLKLAYNARLPPNSRRFPWPERASLIAAQDGLYQVLFADIKGVEASEEYDRSFLKHLVARSENAISEASDEDEAAVGVSRQDWTVNEDILERYVDLVSLPATNTPAAEGCLVGAPVPPAIYLRHYFPLQNGPIDPLLGPSGSVVVREEGVAISQGTTGLKTWEASYRLAAHLVQEQNHWRSDHDRILELGSGAGLLGMLCAQLVQNTRAQLYLTDLEGNVMDRLHETASLSK